MQAHEHLTHRLQAPPFWRAVDQDGYVLDEIVQNRRNTTAAKRLLMRLLKTQGIAPKRMTTDKLRSYGAARRQVMPAVKHWSHKDLNNRAENSHLPLRKRERTMQGFRSPGSLQRFISIFSALRNLFVPPRSKRSVLSIHIHRLQAMAEWKVAVGKRANQHRPLRAFVRTVAVDAEAHVYAIRRSF